MENRVDIYTTKMGKLIDETEARLEKSGMGLGVPFEGESCAKLLSEDSNPFR